MSGKKAFVQSVDRSLQVLELFANSFSLSLIEISRSTGLAKATAFGLIATLEKRDFLCQDELTGRYRLGMRFLELASSSVQRTDIVSKATELLRPIVEKHGLNAHITILDEMSVVYVGHVQPANLSINIRTSIGARAPANCTSTGKAFLAGLNRSRLDDLLSNNELNTLTSQSITDIRKLKKSLSDIRKNGYAIDYEESIIGIIGIGMALFSEDSSPILGISIAGLKNQFQDSIILQCVSELQTVKDTLSLYTSFH